MVQAKSVVAELQPETWLVLSRVCLAHQQITGIPPEGLTAEEIERMRKKFGVSYKFSKFVLDESTAVRYSGKVGGAGEWGRGRNSEDNGRVLLN